MNLRLSSVALILGMLMPAGWSAAQPASIILPETDPETPQTHRYVWETDPGVRYLLEESTDLSGWTPVAGFPTEAGALAQQHAFELQSGNKKFYRVERLDEQAPAIELLDPEDGDFAVGRFDTVEIDLEDYTVVDPATIDLTIGTHGPFTETSPEVSYDAVEERIVVDLGPDTALGAYGEAVSVSLTIADILGNAGTHTYTFELELEPQVADNLFVFGSPDAQRAGQQLDGMAATLAARFGGPVRMNSSTTDWTLHEVTETEVILTYTSATAPTFTVGQLITNMSPESVDEIFYREVTGVSDDTVNQLLTLTTTDLNLPDFLTEGSFALDEESVILELDESGNIVRAIDFEADFELPPLGADLSGTTLFSDGPLTLTVPEAKAILQPALTVALETSWGSVERFHAALTADVEVACVPQLTLSGSYSNMISNEFWSASYWIWGAAGPVPIGLEIKGSLTAEAGLGIDATATMQAGFRQSADMGVSGTYVKDASPAVTWDRWLNINPLEKVPFTYTLNGEGNVTLALIPQVDLRLYGAAGLYMNTNPRLELHGSATFTDSNLEEADWLLGAYADVNAGLSVIGFDTGDLPSLPSFRLFTKEWTAQYPEMTPLEITRQPLSQTAILGDTVEMSVEVTGGDGEYTYQWFHHGLEIPGERERIISLKNTDSLMSGLFFVRIVSGGSEVTSSVVELEIITPSNIGGAFENPETGRTYFVLYDVTPSVAESIAESHSGYLATITSFEENSFIKSKFKNAGACFVGGNAVIEDTQFSWITGEPFEYVEWGTGEPSDYPNIQEPYLVINLSSSSAEFGKVSDVGYSTRNALVEIDGLPGSSVATEMKFIEGGSLYMSMGLVTVGNFYIGQTEVTWDEWKAVRSWAASNGYDIGSRGAGCGDDHPVHSVNWFDALKWCNAKSEMEGLTPVYSNNGSTYRSGQPSDTSISQNLSASGYRLPQEAEWEFAARGGNQTNGYTYAGSNDLDAVGWYADNSGGAACDYFRKLGTWPVGQKAANELGIHDMSGNVWEWCWDHYPSYTRRSTRGGDWAINAFNCTVSVRKGSGPVNRRTTNGFRTTRSSGS